MGTEIERRFKVIGDGWQVGRAIRISQGYLPASGNTLVRVRIADGAATLAVKAASNGIVGARYEYEIPLADAEEMLRCLCGSRVFCKARRNVQVDGRMWEVDAFEGRLEGLVVAAVRLDGEYEVFAPPPWVGEEITGDETYSSRMLAEYAALA